MMFNIEYLVLIHTLFVQVSSNHYCPFKNESEHFYLCYSNEVCCDEGCCVKSKFQLYHLWYLWIPLILLCVVCCYGHCPFKIVRHPPVTQERQDAPGPSTRTTHVVIDQPSRLQHHLLQETLSRCYTTLQSRYQQRRHCQPPPKYSSCACHRFYGPPPSYEAVIQQQTANSLQNENEESIPLSVIGDDPGLPSNFEVIPLSDLNTVRVDVHAESGDSEPKDRRDK